MCWAEACSAGGLGRSRQERWTEVRSCKQRNRWARGTPPRKVPVQWRSIRPRVAGGSASLDLGTSPTRWVSPTQPPTPTPPRRDGTDAGRAWGRVWRTWPSLGVRSCSRDGALSLMGACSPRWSRVPWGLPRGGTERRRRCRRGCAGRRRARPRVSVEVARNARWRSGRASSGIAGPEGRLPGRSPCRGVLSGHGLPGAPPLWTPPWPLRGGPWTPTRWHRWLVVAWFSCGRQSVCAGGSRRGSAEGWGVPGEGRGRAVLGLGADRGLIGDLSGSWKAKRPACPPPPPTTTDTHTTGGRGLRSGVVLRGRQLPTAGVRPAIRQRYARLSRRQATGSKVVTRGRSGGFTAGISAGSG